MKDFKKTKLQDFRDDLKNGDKLERLVLDVAVRKTIGSREDLDGVFYSKNGRHVLMASKSLSGTYIVTEGTREIDADAFWGCAYLEKLVLPEGVETIGHEAFGRCISLRSITLPSTVRKLGVNPFAGLSNISIISKSENISCDGKAVYADGGRTLVAFIADDTVFIVPEGVEEIGEKAFAGKKHLRWITLPKTLKTIDDEAFFDCDDLRSVSLPSSLKSIGECAFGDCARLREVEFLGVPEKMKRSMLAGCDEIRSITVPENTIGKFKKLAKDFDDRVAEKENTKAKS